MKHLKKILALALLAVSLFAIALPAFALPAQPNIQCVNGSCPYVNQIRQAKFISAVQQGVPGGKQWIEWTLQCMGCPWYYYPITYLN